jgi:hypothetical protein
MVCYYTIVQYYPDPIADERINIGVMVFGDDQVRSRFPSGCAIWRGGYFVPTRLRSTCRDMGRSYATSQKGSWSQPLERANARGLAANGPCRRSQERRGSQSPGDRGSPARSRTWRPCGCIGLFGLYGRT